MIIFHTVKSSLACKFVTLNGHLKINNKKIIKCLLYRELKKTITQFTLLQFLLK